MKLEHQVTSLEISKRLKELRVKRKSLFYWSLPDPSKAENEEEKLILQRDCEVMLCHKFSDWGEKFETISAFTVAELGEMLPIGAEFGSSSSKATGGWNASYHHVDPSKGYSCGDYTEADARGKLLIYLLEDALLTQSNKQ